MFASGDLLRSILKNQFSNFLVYPKKIDIDLKSERKTRSRAKISDGFTVFIESIDGLNEFEGQTASGVAQIDDQVVNLPECEITEGILKYVQIFFLLLSLFF